MEKHSKNTEDKKSQRTSTLTISKEAFDRLSVTKELLKKQFNESFSYSDIISAALVLMNKKLFERNNVEVLGYLKVFKQYRLLLSKAEKLRDMGIEIPVSFMEPPSSSDFEALLNFVTSVPVLSPQNPQKKQEDTQKKA